MSTENFKDRVNYVVEKGAYVLAGLIALGFLYLLYSLLGLVSIGLLVGAFILLLVIKIGFLWLLK